MIMPQMENCPNVSTILFPNHRVVPPSANINFVEYFYEGIDPAMYIISIVQSTPKGVSPGLLVHIIGGGLTCENSKKVHLSSIEVDGLDEREFDEKEDENEKGCETTIV